MGGNRANPEENHPEAGRFTIHLQTSFSTQNGLGSNSGRAVGKFTSGSNSSQANLKKNIKIVAETKIIKVKLTY